VDSRESRKPTRKRVMAIVGLWAIVMGAVSLASGCYGHTCDGDAVVFGRNPGEGRLFSADKWESGAIDGVWLDFPKQRAWIFDLHELGGRAPTLVTPYVSAQADPSHESGNFTIAAGNGPGRHPQRHVRRLLPPRRGRGRPPRAECLTSLTDSRRRWRRGSRPVRF
jgi:hypothetical protein